MCQSFSWDWNTDGPLGCSGHEGGAELPLLVLDAVGGSLNTSKYFIQTKIVRKSVICALSPPKSKGKILKMLILGKLFLITYGSQSNIYFYILKKRNHVGELCLSTVWGSWAGIFKHSMGVRNQVRIGLSYRPVRLHMLAELMPWNRFLGSLKL